MTDKAGTDKAAAPATWRREMTASPTLLFRYSAVTFNGHRIHYDRSYVTGVEFYPGLIVHGPLQATWLLQFAEEIGGRRPESFSFRGCSRCSISRCSRCARGARGWVRTLGRDQ
ncbi:hypothetical protein [Acidiphilium sp. C61]|uniref:hypothetical protein n=1 Tax=Acidiphilium sp. C61 TaxID=1671485 RepID=UPI001F3B5D7F|nr:hypothetical protein [Acidiphilium sp. C61]